MVKDKIYDETGKYKGYVERKDFFDHINENCFIATAVYGDINAPQVETLREYRDNVLMQNKIGRFLIDFYYSGAGKKMARFIEERVPSAIPVIRGGLDFLVDNFKLKRLN